MSDDTSWAERALHHVRHLADRIGPRGATTPEEKRAADYTQLQMQKIGLQDVRLESFRAPRSGWLPLAIVFSAAVWGTFICWGGFYLTQMKAIGAIIGAALCLFGVWTVYRQVTFKDHFLRRRLPRSPSVNAIGCIPAADRTKQHVVLVSHLDTHPAAWVFQSPRRAKIFRFLLTASFASLIIGMIMYVLGGFEWWDWGFVFAGLCGLAQSAGILLVIQADQGNFSPGANDNASGVGTVLALAERLQQNPLAHTDVWILCSGSQTINGDGLLAFLDKHADQLSEAWFVGFEGVGIGQRLIYVAREGLLRRSIQPAMRDAIERVIQAQPDLAAQARTATERYTTIGPATWRGFNSACISLYGERDGIPNWRNRKDNSPRIEVEALAKAHEFGWELLQQIEALSGANN